MISVFKVKIHWHTDIKLSQDCFVIAMPVRNGSFYEQNTTTYNNFTGCLQAAVLPVLDN